jgi:hypothetical protein
MPLPTTPDVPLTTTTFPCSVIRYRRVTTLSYFLTTTACSLALVVDYACAAHVAKRILTRILAAVQATVC